MPYCHLLSHVRWVSLRGLLFPEREGRWERWLGGAEEGDTVVRMYRMREL